MPTITRNTGLSFAPEGSTEFLWAFMSPVMKVGSFLGLRLATSLASAVASLTCSFQSLSGSRCAVAKKNFLPVLRWVKIAQAM